MNRNRRSTNGYVGYSTTQLETRMNDHLRFIREKWTRRSNTLTRQTIRDSIVEIRSIRNYVNADQ